VPEFCQVFLGDNVYCHFLIDFSVLQIEVKKKSERGCRGCATPLKGLILLLYYF